MSSKRGLILKQRASLPLIYIFLAGNVLHVPNSLAEDMGFSVWELKASECQTRMTFLGAKTVLYESGTQAATKNYHFKSIRKSDFFSLKMKTTHTNFKPDCRGNKGAGVGDWQETYVRFDDARSKMTFFSSPKNTSGTAITFEKLVFEDE